MLTISDDKELKKRWNLKIRKHLSQMVAKQPVKLVVLKEKKDG